MSIPKYAAKRDDNEQEIVKALEAIGCTVFRLDSPVDLLIGRNARNWLVEVKDGNKPPSHRRLTASQKRFFADWKGQVRVVETAEEAVQLINESYRD